jgi:hypothetical protein
MCSYSSPELHQRRYEVIFGVLTLFCCLWTYFIVCGFNKTIRTCVCFFFVYENYFLFMFTCRNLLVKSSLGGC